MATLLQPCTVSLRSAPSIHNKKTAREQRRDRVHKRTSSGGRLPSAKHSSPTPLLHRPPIPQTKHQALDLVLDEIQASIDRGAGIEPQIFSSLLETCFRLRAFDRTRRLHCLIPPKVLLCNSGIISKLIRLYASSGLVDEAHQLFDQMPRRETSPFTWNALISGYTELGLFEDAMALYQQMEEEGVEPDRFTFPRALKACAGLGLIQVGEDIHRHVLRSGFGDDIFALNALVDMYSKCGDIARARRVFDSISNRDSVSWNSMLVGYFLHGLVAEAMEVFKQMVRAGFEPDSVAISAMLARCSSSLSRRLGFEIHAWVLHRGLDRSLSVANSLISMYAEAGRVDAASEVFERMPERDVVSWNAMISAQCREQQKAMAVFEQMESSGVVPDGITFTVLLSACANSRSVEDGRQVFAKMEETYGMRPLMEHCACMVNLLGRAGLIGEAYEFIEKRLASEAGATVWGALLHACLVHGDVGVGEIAAERLFELEPDNEHNFELLMKIYRNAGRVEEEEQVRQMMKERGLDSVTDIWPVHRNGTAPWKCHEFKQERRNQV